jgi:uncharacterized protein (DUF1330 family)
VPDIVARHGGKVLARGGKFRIMEGPEKFHRFIVIEFPTFEQAVACFNSPEYGKAAAFGATAPARSRMSSSRGWKPLDRPSPPRPQVFELGCARAANDSLFPLAERGLG